MASPTFCCISDSHYASSCWCIWINLIETQYGLWFYYANILQVCKQNYIHKTHISLDFFYIILIYLKIKIKAIHIRSILATDIVKVLIYSFYYILINEILRNIDEMHIFIFRIFTVKIYFPLQWNIFSYFHLSPARLLSFNIQIYKYNIK